MFRSGIYSTKLRDWRVLRWRLWACEQHHLCVCVAVCDTWSAKVCKMMASDSMADILDFGLLVFHTFGV